MGYGNFAIPVLLLLCIVLAVLWMLGRCQFKVIRRKKKRAAMANDEEARLSLVNNEENRRIDIPTVMLTNFCTCQHKMSRLHNKRKSQSEIDLSAYAKNNFPYLETGNSSDLSSATLVRENNLIVQRRFSKSCYFPRIFSSQNLDQQSEDESLNVTMESTLDQPVSDTSSFMEQDSSDNISNNLQMVKSPSTQYLLNTDLFNSFPTSTVQSKECSCNCGLKSHARQIESHDVDFSTFEKTNGFDLQIQSGIHLNFCHFSLYCCWNSNDVTAELIKYHDKLKMIDYKTALLYCSDCVICQEPFTKDSHICMLQCRHIFDVTCVVRWLPHQKKCPLCWTDIGKEAALK